MRPEVFDLVVIGGGSGGLVVASLAAQLGFSVALCEGGRMGGECLNSGCVPSKALLAAAHAAHTARTAEVFGVKATVSVDMQAVHDHVHGVIAALAPHDSVERFEGLGVTVVPAMASFTGPDTVQAGSRTLKARRFVIATGSSPAVPPVPGLADVPYLTNDTLFHLTTLPAHLIVLGGGPIGCEMAQAFRRLGSAVTLVEAGPSLLARDDADLRAVVATRLQAEGVQLHLNSPAAKAERTANGVRLHLPQGPVDGSHLLVATGRAPNVASLNLAAAGVAATARGITVGPSLQTTNPRIYAVGDVAGPYTFTHMAGYQAGVFVQRVLFGNVFAKTASHAVPWCTFTDPELAWVGLSEADARRRHATVRTVTFPFASNDRAQAERATDGLVKLVLGPRDVVLGAGIAGAHAGELIHEWAIFVTHRMRLSKMLPVIHAYPTRAEASKRAAGEAYKAALFAPRTRALSRWLFRLLG